MKTFTISCLLITSICLISSCKSFDPLLIEAQGDKFDPKLPTLRPIVENNIVALVSQDGSTIRGANPFDVKTYFENEVQDVMTNPFDEIKGTITLQVSNFQQKNQVGLSALLIQIPTLFGATSYKGYSNVAITIQIKSNSGKIIGQYKASAEVTEKASLYKKGGSYREKDILRVAYIKSVKKAVQEAKEKMKEDVPVLIEKLEN